MLWFHGFIVGVLLCAMFPRITTTIHEGFAIASTALRYGIAAIASSILERTKNQ